MKNKHLFWGLLFITFGLLFLLNNYMKLSFDWESVWKFWPVVIVLLGLSFLIKNNLAKGFLVSISAILLALAVFALLKAGWYFADNHLPFNWDDNIEKWDHSWNDSWDDTSGDSYDNSEPVSASLVEKYSDSVKKAVLTVEAGAGTFLLKNTSSDLIKINTDGGKDYYLDRYDQNDRAVLDFRAKKTRFSFHKGRFRNKVRFSLNPAPVWDLNFEFGAASIDLDLSKFKTEKIDMGMGAASLKLKLGNLSDKTTFTLGAGASKIEIWVPESSGCEIKSDFALSSREFKGFKKHNSGFYRTENFDNAQKKIYLDIDAGISSVEVNRY